MKRLFDKVGLPNRGVLRLLIAIVISALLHFFWLTELSWELPESTMDRHGIDMRLVTLQPTPVKQTEVPQKIVQQIPSKLATPTRIDQVPEQPSNELILIADEAVMPIQDSPATVVAEAVMRELVETAPDLSLMMPEPPRVEPYQYIDTTFDVYVNEDETRSGTARIIYYASESGRYKLHWSIEALGLLALLYPDLVQTSEGLIDVAQGLRPVNYHYQFGDKADKSYQAAFDWTKGELLLHSSKGDKTVSLTENAQDYLSFMYQFMFKPPLNAMQMSLTNGKRLVSYDYTFEGEETLTLDFGEVKTYHIKHVKSDSDEKTELWLAVDYQFIPVKISKTEKDGQVINQVAKVIYTKPVQLIQELPLP